MNTQANSPAFLCSAAGSRWRSFPFATGLTWLLILFLVLFPKGGIKAGTVPLTWGYMLIALSLPALLAMRLLGLPLVFRKSSLMAFASILPFQLIFFYSYRQNGIGILGAAISEVVSLLILPIAFLLVYPAFYPRLSGPLIARLLRFSIFTAAVFGILLFIEYPLTGHLIEVPYLTVNAADYGLIEATKHINRGFFLKLISTYNNGNVYGVATLILLPIYDRIQPHAWRRHTVRLALVLTLSRTVWAGLIIEQLLSFVPVVVGAARSFPRVAVAGALRRGVAIVATLVFVVFGSLLSAGNLGFLLDSSLGGRRNGLSDVVEASTLLPTIPIGGFFEIIYLSALVTFGLFGCLAFCLIFVFPIFLLLANPAVFRSPMRLAAFKGLMVYLLVGWLDGAINLIPVMAFYWFTYMIFLEGWPGELANRAAGDPPNVGETSARALDTLLRDSQQSWSPASS